MGTEPEVAVILGTPCCVFLSIFDIVNASRIYEMMFTGFWGSGAVDPWPEVLLQHVCNDDISAWNIWSTSQLIRNVWMLVFLSSFEYHIFWIVFKFNVKHFKILVVLLPPNGGYPGIILGMGAANERRLYSVTSCNVVAHWLSPYPEWSVDIHRLHCSQTYLFDCSFLDKKRQCDLWIKLVLICQIWLFECEFKSDWFKSKSEAYPLNTKMKMTTYKIKW